MLNSINENTVNLYNNPFEDINANVLDPQKIVEFWCNPFTIGIISEFNERNFASQNIPIIVQGSRGSGKTTILKYFSYAVQKARAKEQESSLLELIQEESAIGFYLRCEDSFISTFENVFEMQTSDKWLSYFEHYIELLFVKHILNVVMDLYDLGEIDYSAYEKTWVKNASDFTNTGIKDLYLFISKELKYIDTFKNDSIFSNTIFSPKIILKLYQISEKLINGLRHYDSRFNNITFLILIDEFENLNPDLQKFFNTLIKFVKPGISIRIGRRREGNFTTETVNDKEYLREKHDYFLLVLDKKQKLLDQKRFFRQIALKRLSTNNYLNGIFDIVEILGDREDLDDECRRICKGRKIHLEYILNENSIICNNPALCKEIIEIIKNDDKPIAEMLNALWVIRSKKDPIEAAHEAAASMNAFFKKTNHPMVRKYANDYNNKYRYSLTVLLSTAYKQKKSYYGFNTICHLSGGNTRTFLNICRAILSDAIFFEKESFLKTHMVSKDSQSRAIHQFAIDEFEGVCSIIKHGNNIRNLVLNLGNIFTEYHKDRKVRYPETNQFVFDKLSLPTQYTDIINTAESWSMIIKKEGTQRISAGIGRKGDIYYINRAFAPIFSISYRIRGGVNVQFSSEEIITMLHSLNTKKKLPPENYKPIKEIENGQLTLFDRSEF